MKQKYPVFLLNQMHHLSFQKFLPKPIYLSYPFYLFCLFELSKRSIKLIEDLCGQSIFLLLKSGYAYVLCFLLFFNQNFFVTKLLSCFFLTILQRVKFYSFEA